MWRRIRRFFVSLNTASVLLLLLAAATFIAGFFPQFPLDSALSPPEVQWWWNAVREKYGVFFPILRATGLVALYRSPIFWAILLLILIGVIFCSLTRISGKLRPNRLGSVSAHLGLLLLAAGLAISGFSRHIGDSPPLTPGDQFSPGESPLTVRKVWVERSGEGIPLAFGCEVESGGKTFKLSPGWPGLVGGYWLLPVSYGPAWRVMATEPSGEAASLLWKGVGREGEVTVPFPVLGEIQEIAFPEANARMEISVQTQGTFVDFYEGEKLAQRLFVQEGAEIEGEKIRVRLYPENYIVLRVVEDTGFWPAVVGAVIAVAGFTVALFTPERVRD